MLQPSLQESLKVLLDIQDLDMKMIRLLRIRKQRLGELEQIDLLRKELHEQKAEKEKAIEELGKTSHNFEAKIQECAVKIKKLEAQQATTKKVDDFNAITQEMTTVEKERIGLEQKVSDLLDRKILEEEILTKIRESLASSASSSMNVERELQSSVQMINEEGQSLKIARDELSKVAEPQMLAIYERLLKNKKDRVIVPIENRTCTGCHIALTAQHENMVRRADNMVFCEHCSRIHYWPQQQEAEASETTTTKRRRRKTASS